MSPRKWITGVTAPLLASLMQVEASNAALYVMSNVKYTYTMGKGSTGTGCSVSSSDCTGYFSGSFSFTATGNNGGSFTDVNVIASTSPDYTLGTQPNLARADFKFTQGYASAFSGSTQLIYFYTPGKDNNGVELSLSLPSALGTVDPQIASFTGSTANDNWCINVLPVDSTKQGCTSSKNNLSSITGTIQSPAPTIAGGLLPLAIGLLRRRGVSNRPAKSKRRRSSPVLA